MPSPFDPLRRPEVWRQIQNQFYQGCHWQHATERLLAVSVVHLNDALLDLDVRRSPRLNLVGRAGSSTRTLSVHYRNVVRKRNAVTIGAKDIQIGNKFIPLDDEGGAMRLMNALIDSIENFWISHGRDWPEPLD